MVAKEGVSREGTETNLPERAEEENAYPGAAQVARPRITGDAP